MKKLVEIMDDIEYGYKNASGENIALDESKWDLEFKSIYKILNPTELTTQKCGTCIDQVEFERDFFDNRHIACSSYFILGKISEEDRPSHTFLTYRLDSSHFWFEHAWNDFKGIHRYNDEIELLKDVRDKFMKSHGILSKDNVLICKYRKPKPHLSWEAFYRFVSGEEKIYLEDKLN